MQSQGQGGCGIELLGVARYWVKEHITIETPEPSGTLHSCQKTLCHFNAERRGEMTHKGIFYCQMSPWVMKTASHYHKWTTTWMGLSLPKTTLCPSEKQFATMNFKFKEESQELTVYKHCRVYMPHDQVHNCPPGLVSDGHRWTLLGDHQSSLNACHLA